MKPRDAKLRILGKTFRYTVDFFQDQGFIQLMPVMLGKSVDPLGPDPGSSIVEIPEISYQGEVLRLVTSMILHKQVAVKDLKKIFIMSPNIRLERPERKETGRHLFEFTQADFEIAGAGMNDIFDVVEYYYAGLSAFLHKKAEEEFAALGMKPFEFKIPFRRYTTIELKKAYGEDWELLASKEHQQPFWAISHKREFYDKQSSDGSYLNYDIIYPLGFGEGLSGAEREHEYEKIMMRIARDKLDQSAYTRYLEHACQGLVPSAGAGIGMERLARFLTLASHIEEVSVFPRVPGVPVDI